MGFPNKFFAKCKACGSDVAESKGITSGTRGAWVTHCAACAAELPKVDAPAIVYVRRAGLNIAIRATGRMAAEPFAAFRAAVTGSRWDADSKTNLLRVDLARLAVAAIVAAGITVDVDEETKAFLEAKAHEIKAAVDAAEARTATVEAVLAQDGRSLYPYQREGVAWLAGRSAALLADDMGLGKTIQALTAIPLRIRQNYTRPERRRLEALLVRASHLDERIKRDGAARHTHDASELSALGWALAEIMATRGALPEDLDRLRSDIWEPGSRRTAHLIDR